MVRWVRGSAAVCAGVAFITGLAGCGGSSASSTGSRASGSGSPTGTLVWYVNNTPTLTKAVYAKVVDAFTKSHPGTQIKVINQGGQDLGTYFSTLISSGNAPDVGLGIVVTPQNASHFVNMGDQAWAKQLAAKDPLTKDYEVNGGIYTIPVGYQVQDLIFYNKSLFQRAGIASTPTTYQQLDSDMQKLKGLGVVPMADSGAFIAGAQVEAMALSTIFETNLQWEADRMNGKVSFANGPWLTALNEYSNWIKNGYVRKDAVGLQFNAVNTDFLNGKYGMYLVASWFTGNMAQTPAKFPVGVFPVPAQDGKTPPPQSETGAFTWEIPTTTKHKALAEEFVKYLATNKAGIAPLVQADGDFTNTTMYPLNSVGQDIQKIAASAPKVGVPGAGNNVEPNGFNAYEYQAVQGLWVGKSGSDVANELDSWWNQHKNSGA